MISGMRRSGVWTLVGLAVLVLVSCVSATPTGSGLSEPGLQIPSVQTSIGAVGGNPDRQAFSYTVALWNKQTEAVHLNWVEPVLSNRFAERVLTEDRRMTVDKTLAPGDAVEVSGQLHFDAAGLSKTELEALQPSLLRMRVSSEQVLQLPGPGRQTPPAVQTKPRPQSRLEIGQVQVTADQVTFRGRVQPDSGVCVQTLLLADGEPQPWWPADVCATAKDDGTWSMTVPLRAGTAPDELDPTVQYVARARLGDEPAVQAQFWFDLAAPPTPASTPDVTLLLPESAEPLHRAAADLEQSRHHD